MANKRMFNLSVVDTDNFLEMPISSRLLYYELGMRADDDGFVDSWRKILLFTGLKEDDMKILITKKFIIPFESGVIVIRHWRLNNYLQKDRTKPTIYQEELKQLGLDENNVYEMNTECIHSIDKNSIDKNSIEYKERKFKEPTLEEVKTYCKERNNDVDAKKFIDYYQVNNWKDKDGKQIKNWKQKLITWENHNNKNIKKEASVPKWFDKDLNKEEVDEDYEQFLKNIGRSN